MAASFTLVLQRALVLAAILASCVYWANLSLAFIHGVGRTTLKAFPVLCMAAACLLKCSEEENPYPRFSALLALGLLLGACGDVFLAVGDSYFLEGLGAFLCGHIAYITAFSVAHPPLFRLRRAVLPLLYGVVMFGVLCAYMKAAFIGPVLVYCLALSCVVWKAAARSSTRFPLAGVQLGCVGALAFLASDSTLAFTKFVGDFQGSEFVVMVTYYVAQVCIGSAGSVALGSERGLACLAAWSGEEGEGHAEVDVALLQEESPVEPAPVSRF